MKQVSLSELSLELKINKSKLAYFSQLGLILPIATVGGMKIFDTEKTKNTLKKITELKKKGKKLSEIKEILS
jgi:DNA-binding transcriptional MerR regulator